MSLIHADRLQVCRNIQENVLVKGEVSDAFNYNSNELLFPKTGLEIKTLIEKTLGEKIAKLQANAERLSDLSEIIESKPDQETYICESDKEGVLKVCPFADKKYSWNMCNLYSNLDNTIVPIGLYEKDITGKAKTKQEAQNCCEYNNLVDKCISIVKDMLVLKTIKDNVVDKTTYQLTLNQINSINSL